MSQELRTALTVLATRLREEIIDGLSDGSLRQTETTVLVWKVDQFTKTDGGIIPSGASGDYTNRKDWSQAIVKLLIDSQKTPEFENASKALNQEFETSRTQFAIDNFVSRIAGDLLNNPKMGEEYFKDTTTILIKGLKEELLRYSATGGLLGIQVASDSVEADHGLLIRQPTVEDLEAEILPFSPVGFSPLQPYPTAILRIEILARRANELQPRIEHAVTMLRLFRVGSVTVPSYRFSSESITDPFGRIGYSSGSASRPLEQYMIRNNEISALKAFWRSLGAVIPPSFYEQNLAGGDHLTIAYRRYVDALMQNGVVERRIANAVMGLEALLLTGEEVQELVYRLSNRLSKLLVILGLDQYEVRQTIRDAYRVRNLFVHGSQLGDKESKKLEIKYKGVRNLMSRTLNYLRVVLVALILTRKGKEELIDNIDDSLIDNKRDEELSASMRTAKEIISQSG